MNTSKQNRIKVSAIRSLKPISTSTLVRTQRRELYHLKVVGDRFRTFKKTYQIAIAIARQS
ncbi:MAG: hypothetical protein MUD14_08125 [Hydrococcus sp. Prado102]|nr:hypothetical protein [Hydrococcus sp. Prado102]